MQESPQFASKSSSSLESQAHKDMRTPANRYTLVSFCSRISATLDSKDSRLQ